MAQDSGSQNSGKGQEVDLDNLEVEILILCKNVSTLNSSAAFLTRRGWPTTVINSVSKAIEHIAEKKPDFVLISFSHSSPSVLKLPDLITQTFNLSCIGFIETFDKASQNYLNNFKIRYKIQGAPSGPNLQRSLRKILAEKFNIRTEGASNERNDRHSDGASGVVTVKGAASSSERSGVIVQGSQTGVGENQLGQRNRKSLRDLTIVQSTGPELGGETPSGPDSAELLASLKKSLFGESGLDSTRADEDVGGIARSQEPSVGALERAVDASLRQICRRTTEEDARPLQRLTKVAVFPVDSPSLAGYLVLGVEQRPDQIEDFFLKACETALRDDFINFHVPACLEAGFWVHVPEVAFAEWIAEKAEFHIVIPHDGSEVGAAFFPIARSLPRARGDQETGMFSIAIDDISTGQPVNFKAYLHLKKNKKYFLYLRHGRQLQPEQKERLKGHQVKDIFMKSADVDNLRMFLAASYLRASIKAAG